MTVSFQAFRDRYPAASITSEVLLVQSDQFVVKVTVATDSAGCATGLAAHSAIEVAEDRARHRALVALGWLLDAPSPASSPDANGGTAVRSTSLPATPTDQESAASPGPIQPSPVPNEHPASPLPTPQSASSVTQVEAQPVVTATSPPPLPTTAAAIAEPMPTSPPVSQPAESPPPPKPELESVPASEPEPAPAPEPISPEALPAPINLSDVIAQTDIELRRLGWSVETGREYLEKTYQKRSRHELSEDELIQFLCHLESL